MALTLADGALAGSSPVPAPPSSNADHVAEPSAPRHRTFGMVMDLGVPDGAALGLVVRPKFDWLRISAAVTHNGMAPGARAGITLDPIAFPIAPTLTVEGGHYWEGTVPVVKDSPAIGYNYANFHLGLEAGNRATFRFFLRGGVSWVDISATHLPTGGGMSSGGAMGGSGSSGASALSDPSYTGWLAPSGKLGFSAYF